jgi:hypothetical protein
MDLFNAAINSLDQITHFLRNIMEGIKKGTIQHAAYKGMAAADLLLMDGLPLT